MNVGQMIVGLMIVGLLNATPDTDYCTRKVKGTLGEIVESIINKHGFETMILDFTLTHEKHIIYRNSLRKFLTKQVKNNSKN